MDRPVAIGPSEIANREVFVTATPGVTLLQVPPFESAVFVRLRNAGVNAVLLSFSSEPLQSSFPLNVGVELELILTPNSTLRAVRESSAGADVPVRVWAAPVWDGIPFNPVGRDFTEAFARER